MRWVIDSAVAVLCAFAANCSVPVEAVKLAAQYLETRSSFHKSLELSVNTWIVSPNCSDPV